MFLQCAGWSQALLLCVCHRNPAGQRQTDDAAGQRRGSDEFAPVRVLAALRHPVHAERECVDPRGEGRAAWLVDPGTGATVRGEASEATLLHMDILEGGRTHGLEQVAVVESTLRSEEAAP